MACACGWRQQLQREHFSNLLRVYLLSPSENTQYFCQLIAFVSNVAHFYKGDLGGFEQQLLSLLEERSASLDQKLRGTLVKSIILLRSQDMLAASTTLPLFFRLLGTQDKALRETLQKHIMADLRGINLVHRNEKTNKLLQNFLFTLLRESDEMTSACATEIVVNLYNQKIWTGAKTVNVLATAALSPITKVASRALRFFLTDDAAAHETDEAREKRVTELAEQVAEVHRLNNNYSKKTKNRHAKLDKKEHYLSAKRQRVIEDDTAVNVNFPAIQLIDDPQGFAERMLQNLRKVRETLDVRLLRMNLISRVVATHEIFLDGFYAHLIKYIQPHQEKCTYVLSCLAQACHSLVDPETLRPALNAVVDRFVSDRARPEVMAVGINTVREICARTPLVMDATLLTDLLGYVKHRDKPVAAAARSLLNLYRVLDPSLLHKTQRGLEAVRNPSQPLQYGETSASVGVDNIHLLQRYRQFGDEFPFVAANGKRNADDDDGGEQVGADDGGDDDGSVSLADGEEAVDDDDDDGSGGWIDVEDDGNDGDDGDHEDGDGDGDDDDEDGDDDDDDDDDDDSDDGENSESSDGDDDVAVAAAVSGSKRKASEARLDATRILSDKDFADLEKAVEVARDAGSNALKRKRLAAVEETVGSLTAPIDIKALERGVRVALTKEERLAKFGPEVKRAERKSKFGLTARANAKSKGSLTNADKEHRKSHLLTRFGARARSKFAEKKEPKRRFKGRVNKH